MEFETEEQYASSLTKSRGAVLELSGVDLILGRRLILSGIDWRVRRHERWVLLGPNGSGKTSLCRLASLYVQPSHGTMKVFGRQLGRTDARELRTQLGFTSLALADMLQPGLKVIDVVVTGKHAALTPWWHTYTETDRTRARDLLERFEVGDLYKARFGTLSAGERQRVLLARMLMSQSSLLLLDEPTAGLDLGGREQLVRLLSELAEDTLAPATVLVTHHVDEIPRGFTHLLLLAAGRIQASGPIDDTLTAEHLSRCFGVPLQLKHRDGRWMAWGT